MIEIYEKVKSMSNDKKVKFKFYRIATGIKNILSKTITGIEHLLPKLEEVQSQQLNLFKRC